MNLIIDKQNHSVEITAQSGNVTVKTEKGTYVRQDAYVERWEPVTEEDFARLLHSMMAVICNGIAVTDFETWEQLWFSGADLANDEDDPEIIREYNEAVARDRADFELEQREAKAWAESSDLNAPRIYDYLTEKYHI